MLTDAEVIQLMREFLLGQRPLEALRLAAAPPAQMGGWPEMPDAAAPPAPAQTAPIRLDALPDAPVVAPLLPLLEEVQMETARVLPEIDQTLEQVDVALAGVDASGASLAPAPLQLPKIKDSMAAASAAVDKTLGAL